MYKPYTFPVKNQRDIEKPKLEGVSGNHLVQPFAEGKALDQMIQGHPNRVLNTSSKGDSTPPLGKLLQCLIVLTKKNHLSWLTRDDGEGL